MFYLFDNGKTDSKSIKSKKKKVSDSENSKHISEESLYKQEFSIRDIIHMETNDLNSKIFTFNQRLATQDLSKMATTTKNIDLVIKNLPSMKNIDEEYVPKFKFI